jgi:hypothetical protein
VEAPVFDLKVALDNENYDIKVKLVAEVIVAFRLNRPAYVGKPACFFGDPRIHTAQVIA